MTERPQHPDFWLISQALIDTDAQSDAGQGFARIIERLVDVDSLTYAAQQRARRMPVKAALRPAIEAGWIDGFMAGARFQHLKTSKAQEIGEEEQP